MRLAINGFGRIGRTVLRQILARPLGDIEVALINDIATGEMCAHLFQYDSTYGPYPEAVGFEAGVLSVGARQFALHQCDDLSQLPLDGVDVVLECTGIARTSDVARRGLAAGARKVLISGPSVAAELSVVLGANEHSLNDQRVVSNGSCTTNAVAVLAAVLDQVAGIERAHMTTIHCYTNSQPMVDAPRGDLARSRAGALSMVPTTTSAMHLVDDVLPALAGRISGAAVRVPTASVSAVDMVAQLRAPLDVAALRAAIAASDVLGWTEAPLVSSDLRARAESLIVAGPETRLMGTQARVFGWYDNEWGFGARMLDVARLMANGAP
ncbi:MAG: type I glyceraldehyde-3-phosphate dehydrogenase [Sedimentitalea sp.]